jgi:hypothetical protein
VSAFSLGIFLGSIAAALTFVPKAFENPVGPFFLTILGGFLGLFLFAGFHFPDGLGYVGLFLGIVLVNGSCWLFGRSAIEAQSKRRIAATNALRERSEAAAAAKCQVERDKSAWLETLKGWRFQTFGRVLNLKSRPKCIIALGADDRLLRIAQFSDEGKFEVLSDKILALNKIISLDIAFPTVTKTVYDVQAVPIVSKQKRSPVGRAVVGGILLGPLGAVVGAASGLNGAVTTNVEERQVAKKIESRGDAQLILGIADVEVPVLKIELEPPQLAGEWLHRIRAAQMKI